MITKRATDYFLDTLLSRGAVFCAAEERLGGFELRAISEEKHPISGANLFIRPGIHDVLSRAFDPHDTRAGAGAQADFADELSSGRGTL